MSKLRFDGRVAIITGAGGGLGRAYALYFASLGCSVVVNDLGGSRAGEGASTRAADLVVEEIKRAGGRATANYDSVENGQAIVDQAIRDFGRIDIVVNNAGILRDKSFAKMTDQDWDLIYRVHVYGAFKVTKAAWPHFQSQGYGRIIMTASAAGLYGNYGQSNYGSAKMSLVGFGETLAREGTKKNITCNIIAPVAGSRITETVLPADLLESLKPDYVAPFVAYLCHEICKETGATYEVGAGYGTKVRWQRSSGALLKVDDPSFTPAAVAKAIPAATDFSIPQYPQSMAETNWMGLLQESKNLSANPQVPPLRFDGRVALVTGAGGGLGRGYALMLGSLGAKVVVNDLGKDKNGKSLADIVVEEIKSKGGDATANYDSVENGQEIVNQIISKYNRIDVVINNAGILRDKSFAKMNEEEWNLVLAVHLRGTYKVTKAAWPHMVKQNYGRIVNTSSAVGLYGNFGQANYSCAKAGIIGISSSLAAEGRRSNIFVNTIAPNAGTQMTATIYPKDMVDVLRPEYVAPLVGFLSHELNNLSGAIFEVGSGWFSQVRWERSKGYRLDPTNLSIDAVAAKWPKFSDFSSPVDYPKNAQESFMSIAALISKPLPSTGADPAKGEVFSYTKRDVMLYNLGVGCSEKEIKYVFEQNSEFSAIPTFGVIPAFVIMMSADMNGFVNNFNPALLLHGEHYLEVFEKIPVEGKVSSVATPLQVVAKGKGCVVVLQLSTYDDKGNLLFINEGTIFIRGARPKKEINKASERCKMAIETSSLPDRKPDSVTRQKIPENQAAIYRLSGDYNPLHIDSDFAKMGGFSKPILHGLCSYGHAAQHVLKAFGDDDPRRFKAIKARFTKHVFPGETLQTEMWKLSPTRIAFQVRVLERDEIVIGNAFVELQEVPSQPLGEKGTRSSLIAADIFKQFEETYRGLPETTKNDLLKNVNGIFQFDIKDGEGKVHSFMIDMKNAPGQIAAGPAAKAEVTFIVKDEHFNDLATTKVSGQQAYLKGLVQIKGNMMLAMKLDKVLKVLSSAGPKSPSSIPITSPSLRSAQIFAQYEKIFSTLPDVIKQQQVRKVGAVYQFEVKDPDGKLHSFFIDLKNGNGKIGIGTAPSADITITLKDEDFVSISSGKLSGQKAFMTGALKVKGNMMLGTKLDGVLKALSANTKPKL